MNLVILHNNFHTENHCGFLQSAVSSELIAAFTLNGLAHAHCLDKGSQKIVIAMPEAWPVNLPKTSTRITTYKENLPIDLWHRRKGNIDTWFVVSNGQFVTQFDHKWLYRILAGSDADVIAVSADPDLAAFQERVRTTPRGDVVSFRRLYCDSAQVAPVPADWPHHVFLKPKVLDNFLINGAMPLSFSEFITRCNTKKLNLCSLNIAGGVLDLETEKGLLALICNRLNAGTRNRSNVYHRYPAEKTSDTNQSNISPEVRLFGTVVLGQNVSIGRDVIILGPTIIGDNVRIERGAAIRSSIIGPGQSVPPNHLIQNRVLLGSQRNLEHLAYHRGNGVLRYGNTNLFGPTPKNSRFRSWSRFSYTRCLKRIADVTLATIVLILFAPVLPIIALAIKLSSPGPVFFKDKRQSLHGKEFYCLKFRSMMIDAEEIQDRLRGRSEIDGPQFKMKKDPRITTVGRFLRDTFLDEIPQFFNVLVGQMSTVGPRPSPESENSLCPYWRDARLSMRPGITGLWQIRRTRSEGQDFQEWIHYDTKYVRDVSLTLDLWICYQTIKKLIRDFARQF